MNLNQGREQIAANQMLFDEAVKEAYLALRHDDLQSVIAWSKIAAHFAFIRHPGFYMSPTLESILLETAKKIESCIPNNGALYPKSSVRDYGKMHILHVITESYGTGGHSPFIARWIKNTTDNSVHSLIATSQADNLPDILKTSIKDSGGWYCSLTELSPNLVEQALLLRLMTQSWTDVIVLLVHPFDPLPITAFGIEGGPPVVFCNHSDHAFWLGKCIADVIADYHESGKQLSAKRRGNSISKILPIPLPRVNPEIIHIDCKELGFSKDNIVLLTIGREEKFLPFNGYDFLEVIVKVLKKHPNAILIAVGPKLVDEWYNASASVDWRIKALGTLDRETLEKYYNCADLYVSSFPCGSGTSMLEAGIHSLPIIGLHLRELPHISINDDVAFKHLKVHALSTQEYFITLESMINNLEIYRQQAKHVRENIEREHCSPGWNDYLNSLLQSLPSQHIVKNPDYVEEEIDFSDIYYCHLSSKMMSNELPEHSFNRLVRVYSRHLTKAKVFNSQTRNHFRAVRRINSFRHLRQFFLESKEVLTSL